MIPAWPAGRPVSAPAQASPTGRSRGTWPSTKFERLCSLLRRLGSRAQPQARARSLYQGRTPQGGAVRRERLDAKLAKVEAGASQPTPSPPSHAVVRCQKL
jgi:hypothetical protein